MDKLMEPGLALGIGCFAGILILFTFRKYQECKKENESAASNSIPTYEDATKDDPPRYDQIDHLPPSYVI